MDIFKLSRTFFDWSFENPEKITPTHTALYFFAIEHCNRLWWKKKFWFPTSMAKEAIWVKSYNTYSKVFDDLVEWGFFELIEKSKNQYSANIIALSNFDKALDKALDKAMIKHKWKQNESKWQSIDSIDIHNTNIPETNLPIIEVNEYEEWMNYLKNFSIKSLIPDYAEEYRDEWIKFCYYWSEKWKTWKIRAEWEKTFEIKRRFATWISRKKETYQKPEKRSVMDIVL